VTNRFLACDILNMVCYVQKTLSFEVCLPVGYISKAFSRNWSTVGAKIEELIILLSVMKLFAFYIPIDAFCVYFSLLDKSSLFAIPHHAGLFT
jgi:hypothetical protein